MDAWVALWILLILTWAVTGAGFAWVYGTAVRKFRQHTETARRLQQAIADIEEDMTRPVKRGGRC